MTEPLLTILTPAYNRRHLLPRLYESILRQDVPEGSFEWLVIDDGSTDDTATYLSELAESHPGFIRFETTPNGGKHRALNRGAILARGEWVMVVDSDDWLFDDAVCTALSETNSLRNDPTVALIAGLLAIENGFLQNEFAVQENPCRFTDWISAQPKFDFCPIFRANVLKEHPFPEVPGENFMAESWQYHRVAHSYLTMFVNKYVVHAEYQPDGLSTKNTLLRMRSPISAMLVYEEIARSLLPSRFRGRAALNFWRYRWHAWWEAKQVPETISPPIGWLLPAGILFLHDLWSTRGS